jgi:hypothetical protein
MNLLTTLIGWIPRVLLFALAGAIQVALIAVMVYDRVRVLREGSEVTLQTRPVDPRDLLRGDYVVLDYEISSLPAGELHNTPSQGRGTPLFVKLARKDGGVYGALSVHTEPVADPRPRDLRSELRSQSPRVLRPVAHHLWHRALFRAAGRGQGDRTLPQPGQGLDRGLGDAGGTRRHQTVVAGRQAGLR